GAGGQGGRATLHRRGDENGECAERRARRDRQGDPVQGRRFARGRRSDHGVRMSGSKLISSGSPFEKANGYSRAVVVGDEVHIAGPTGYDYAKMTMPDDVAEQTRNIYATFAKVMKEAGGELADIVP